MLRLKQKNQKMGTLQINRKKSRGGGGNSKTDKPFYIYFYGYLKLKNYKKKQNIALTPNTLNERVKNFESLPWYCPVMTNTKSHLETNMWTCKHKYWGSYNQTMAIGGEARKWWHSHTRDLTLFGFTRRQHELGLRPSTWENQGIVNCGDQETSWRRLSSKSGWPREGLGWLV